MIILLDTASYEVKLRLIDGAESLLDVSWQADRGLAKGLLEWLTQQIEANDKKWSDITGLGVYRGPGSFTGLRIGITVMNTLAESLDIPIVGGLGEEWQADAASRLRSGEDEKLVLPYYDRDAIITKQRK